MRCSIDPSSVPSHSMRREASYFAVCLPLPQATTSLQALQAVEAALKCNPQSEEMAKKARALKKMRDFAKPQSKKDKENQEKNKPVNRGTSIQGKLKGSDQVWVDQNVSSKLKS